MVRATCRLNERHRVRTLPYPWRRHDKAALVTVENTNDEGDP